MDHFETLLTRSRRLLGYSLTFLNKEILIESFLQVKHITQLVTISMFPCLVRLQRALQLVCVFHLVELSILQSLIEGVLPTLLPLKRLRLLNMYVKVALVHLEEREHFLGNRSGI